MMPMLRFFRHGDGYFAHFNGMGPTSPDLLATVLAYDDARGTPVANASHSGYQRMEAGPSVVLVDTGGPPPLSVSSEAHAGCLSFELSSGQHRIVVNCGMPATGKEAWRHLARATAAHSTVTFNDVSSCSFVEASAFRRLFGTPIASGPRRVSVVREERDQTILLRSAHDGYVSRFGVIHQRNIVVWADGQKLEGEDLFIPAKGDALPADVPDEFAVRFHLHPLVKANRVNDGHGVMLVLPNKDVWNFHAHEDQVEIEESVYLAGQDGPRRTFQIVIYGQARQVHRVHWTFGHFTQSQPATRRARGEEPELPL
jgi:uncharacterized heparinase superfamily protein